MATTEAASNCARILSWLTRDWQPADGNAATLQDARTALAETIVALNGAGFPEPASGDTWINSLSDSVWKSCAAAAGSATNADTTVGSFGNFVVFWSSDPDNPAKLGDKPGLGLNWPFLPGSHVKRISGPILESQGSPPKRLFFFDQVDPSALEVDKNLSSGFWPKPSALQAQAAQVLVQTPPQTPVAGTGTPKTTLATSLFALWVIVGIYVSVWFWFIARFAGQARPFTGKTVLDQLFWIPLKVDETHYSLLLPFLIIMASFSLLAVAAGLAVNGLWFGALIDERNRFSLSRTQQVAWSVLLLGSLGVMGWFNATTGLASADNLFPEMSGPLWAALGINLALSPLIGSTILNIKDEKGKEQNQATASAPATATAIVAPAVLAENLTPQAASWVDLVTGEAEGTQNQIDVSRLQHLVISGLLLTTYFIEVLKKLVDLPVGSPLVPFDKMPPVGETFVALLAFSHAGYLIFKARQKQGDGTDPAVKH